MGKQFMEKTVSLLAQHTFFGCSVPGVWMYSPFPKQTDIGSSIQIHHVTYD